MRGEDQDVAVAGRPRVRQHGALGSGRKGDSTRTELLPRENSQRTPKYDRDIRKKERVLTDGDERDAGCGDKLHRAAV